MSLYRNLSTTLDDLLTQIVDEPPPSTATGNVVVTLDNTWNSRAVRALDEPQTAAVLEALALTIRYDGSVTRAEQVALQGEANDLGQARGVAADALLEAIARAEERVEFALSAVSLREDARAARRAAAEQLARSIAARLTSDKVRRLVFQTVVRIARGSSGESASSEELIELLAAAFALEVPEA